MKIILIIFVFLFSYSHCYSEWKSLYRQNNGDNIYLDFQSIRFKERFVYWNELINFHKPIAGIMSMSVNMKGDCEKLQQKSVEFKYFSKHFGDKFVKSSFNKGKKWVILDTKSIQYKVLKKICTP
tara:strand:- start:324 stop:698 length:375 start_codon:yes stop_codon:yes gene_type:complete